MLKRKMSEPGLMWLGKGACLAEGVRQACYAYKRKNGYWPSIVYIHKHQGTAATAVVRITRGVQVKVTPMESMLEDHYYARREEDPGTAS